ncbi:ATP-binding protein [Pseudoalteromonas sp. T1lg48]|uniref:ATP-binding protein n=1 Tax=Pseudoalteromonas sp. T1lg48 TaxID=2077100 RepID=UPI000CF68B4D|nr:ATP-binding protein [Pseudoalteromonas sp. T1lg48]
MIKGLISFKNFIRNCFILIVLLLQSANAAAKFSSSLFSLPLFSVESNNLLPSKEILKLAQDEQGFIWVGTRNGVYRFDGYQYQPLLATNDEVNLTNIHVRSLLADGDTLWIGSMTRGLFKVSLSSGHAQQYFQDKQNQENNDKSVGGNQVNGLKRDSSGSLWIAHSYGLSKLDIETETFTQFKSLDNATDRYFNYLLDVELDKSDDVWLATAKGIAKLNLAKQGFNLVTDKAGNDSVINVVARRLFTASDGRIWVGTQRQGTYLIDPASDKISKLESSAGKTPSIDTGIAESKAIDGEPRQIWISGYDGIEVRQATTGEILYRFEGNLLDSYGLKSNTVYPILTSKSGLIWLGVNQYGLQYFVPDVQQYQVVNRFHRALEPVFSSFIQNVIKVNVQSILVLNADKPYRVNLATGNVSPFFTTPEYINTSVVGGVVNDDGTFWLGSTNGSIIKTDADGKVLLELTLPLTKNQGVFVYTLVKGLNNELWIGTDRGLVKLDLTTNQLSPALADGKPFIAFVRSLYVDTQNRIWAGTINGVGVIESGELNATIYTEQRHTNNTLTNNYIVQVTELADGSLIVYTRGGLFKLISETKNEKLFEPFAAELFTGAVLEEGILPTHDGGLLIGAGKKVTANGEQVLALTAKDGNIVNGRSKAFFALNNDYYLYATSHAITLFNNQLKANWHYQAPLAITSLHIDDAAFNLNPNTPKLNLTAENTELTLRISALDYSQPEKNQYRYQLIGFDEKWHTTPWDVRQIRYTGLAPGQYQLNIQGSNRNGMWTEPSTSIAVTVQPKFYQTLVFKSLLVLSVLVLAYWLFRWQLALAKRKQWQKLEQTQAIERAEMMSELMNQKNQLLAEVSHDLRTPISMIKLQLEAMQDGMLAPDEKSYERMQKRITNLNQLVGDIYQLSMADNHMLRLDKQPCDIACLLSEALDAYQPLLEQKQLSLIFDNQLPEHSVYLLMLDGARMLQVFSNLLKNSGRYTDNGGQVKVTISDDKNKARHIQITFEDSAPAVDLDELTHLFDRLYRAPSNKSKSADGSGLGLWICRTIVESHQGEIDAQLSTLGGIAVNISLPVSVFSSK